MIIIIKNLVLHFTPQKEYNYTSSNMKVFQCSNCQHPLYFEDYQCANCNFAIGYRDYDRTMLSFSFISNQMEGVGEVGYYKYCSNHQHLVCNWVLPYNSPEEFCSACQLNKTIPNLKNFKNFEKWRNLEIAKHRLIYQLQKLGLPTISKIKNKVDGFCFDFVSRQINPKLMTGHDNGLITILLSEADSVERERMRKLMLEPYRTLIGHLRHEVGHYYWERLIRDYPQTLYEYRNLFGDESLDYGQALKNYYARSDNFYWQNNYISKYASAHSWEDWAETWAHYFHIMDMVETAHFFNLSVQPQNIPQDLHATASYDPYNTVSFEDIVKTCIPISFAVNSINRAMGIIEVYPFSITPAVIEKLTFIHNLIAPLRGLTNDLII